MKGEGWESKRAEESTVLAEALLVSDRPALAQVWCGSRSHRLGYVYDLPDRGLTLVLVESVMLARDIYDDPRDPLEPVTLLAGTYAFTPGLRTVRRCRCGTWAINTERLADEYGAGSRSLLADHTEHVSRRRGDKAQRP